MQYNLFYKITVCNLKIEDRFIFFLINSWILWMWRCGHYIMTCFFSRFMQIRHFTQKLIPQFPYKPPATHVDMFLSVNPTLKGSISVFFNLISKLHSPSLAAIKTLWEQDLPSQSCEIQSWIGYTLPPCAPSMLLRNLK